MKKQKKSTRPYFEVRSKNKENCYNDIIPLRFAMKSSIPFENLEIPQKTDQILTKRISKILERLPDIES